VDQWLRSCGIDDLTELDIPVMEACWTHFGSLVLSGMNKWYDTNQLCIRSRPLNVDKRANR
jgi:hypothetical protein